MPKKLEYIATETFNRISDELPASGWKLIEEYKGFDAWIDYGLLVFTKDGATIRMEWDNWMEGIIEGPDELLEEIRAKYGLK